jgi:hypothetical protein
MALGTLILLRAGRNQISVLGNLSIWDPVTHPKHARFCRYPPSYVPFQQKTERPPVEDKGYWPIAGKRAS